MTRIVFIEVLVVNLIISLIMIRKGSSKILIMIKRELTLEIKNLEKIAEFFLIKKV